MILIVQVHPLALTVLSALSKCELASHKQTVTRIDSPKLLLKGRWFLIDSATGVNRCRVGENEGTDEIEHPTRTNSSHQLQQRYQ